jgi:hypothetical protein
MNNKEENKFIFVFLILQIDELNHRNQNHLNHHLLPEVVPVLLNDLVQLALEEMDHEMEILHHYQN